MKIEIVADRHQYIMDIVGTNGSARFACSDLNECFDKAKKFIKRVRHHGTMTFSVVTHGYDANGSPVEELVTQASG